jgi:four helix bundle protein
MQIFDSCRSITANIAEGFGRFHHQENIQFSRQSRGSLGETLEHMITGYDEKYIFEKYFGRRKIKITKNV